MSKEWGVLYCVAFPVWRSPLYNFAVCCSLLCSFCCVLFCVVFAMWWFLLHRFCCVVFSGVQVLLFFCCVAFNGLWSLLHSFCCHLLFLFFCRFCWGALAMWVYCVKFCVAWLWLCGGLCCVAFTMQLCGYCCTVLLLCNFCCALISIMQLLLCDCLAMPLHNYKTQGLQIVKYAITTKMHFLMQNKPHLNVQTPWISYMQKSSHLIGQNVF